MPISINGSGTITGINAGGLPDGVIQEADLATASVTADKLASNSVTTAKLGSAEQSGLCKAWVNFDGTKDTTGATSTANTNRLIRASNNVTSVLRNGTGDYTVTFTTAMADANYSATFGSAVEGASVGGFACINDASIPTASALRIRSVSTGATSTVISDKAYIHVAIFR